LTAIVMVYVVLVLCLATGATASPSKTRHLYAWAKFWRSPAVGLNTVGYHDVKPPRIKRLRAGTYRLTIYATDMLGFHLVGPGSDRHTRVALYERQYTVVSPTWTVRLKRGFYRYGGIGPYVTTARGVSGSFIVY
jgi:hypothetical protein